jgi:O-antigen/teichoic acid export membrane protein
LDGPEPVTYTRVPSRLAESLTDIVPIEPPPEPGVVSSIPPPPAVHGAKRAAVVEVIAYVANIVIRLGSNLILTRLLFPKAFGLMAIFHGVNYVLWMLSDTGITQAVVMSPHGSERKFLDTAFSIQAMRGLMLWLVMCVITWPVAHLYGESDLLWILPISSFATAIHGLQSPRVFLLRKHVRPLPLLKLDLSTQLTTTILCVTLAYLGWGVKSMVVAWMAVSILYTLGSHFLPGSDYRPRFGIDAESRHEIMHFGRWIFLSSCLTSVSQKGDGLVLGKLLGVETLGIYSIAVQLAEMPEALVNNIINSAVFPTLSRVKNEQPAQFSAAFYHIRAWLDPLVFVALGGLSGMAPWVVGLFYDDRYSLAATALQVLAFRTAFQVLAVLCETCFTAHGESQFSFRRNLFVSSSLIIAMPLGAWKWGLQGVIWGSALARGMALAALWPEARRRGYLRLRREAIVVPLLLAGYVLGTTLTWALPNPRLIRADLGELKDNVKAYVVGLTAH